MPRNLDDSCDELARSLGTTVLNLVRDVPGNFFDQNLASCVVVMRRDYAPVVKDQLLLVAVQQGTLFEPQQLFLSPTVANLNFKLNCYSVTSLFNYNFDEALLRDECNKRSRHPYAPLRA